MVSQDLCNRWTCNKSASKEHNNKFDAWTAGDCGVSKVERVEKSQSKVCIQPSMPGKYASSRWILCRCIILDELWTNNVLLITRPQLYTLIIIIIIILLLFERHEVDEKQRAEQCTFHFHVQIHRNCKYALVFWFTFAPIHANLRNINEHVMPKLSAVVNISFAMPDHCFVIAPSCYVPSLLYNCKTFEHLAATTFKQQTGNSMSAQHLQHLLQHGPRITNWVSPAGFLMS